MSGLRPADESLTVTSIVCPHCGTALDAVEEVCSQCGMSTTATPQSSPLRRRILDRPWVIILVMLHLGLLGIPLYWKTNYSVAMRLMFVVASILYTIFAVLVIIWALMQIGEAVRLLSN
jgi:hypothetical protein